MNTTVSSPSTGSISLPFTDIELTNSINQLPTPFGQMMAEGYFPPEGLTSQYFAIEIDNDVVSALPLTGEGPPTLAKHGTSEERIFRVPNISHQDDILARDIRGWLALAGRTNNPRTLVELMNKRLMTFKRKFDLTTELMRTSAIKGIVVDGKGNEVLNLYTAFGLTAKDVYFDFATNPTTPDGHIQKACDLVYQLITQDLSDETMTTVVAKVSRDFFNNLTTHHETQAFWLQAEQALQLANVIRGKDGGYRPRSFTFGNITFEEYSAVIPMWGGTSSPIIASNTGHAFPAGTQDTHVTYVAPPEDIRELDGEAASIDDLLHLTTEPMKHGRGVEMLGRMDALPFWRRPKLLVTLHGASGSSTTPIGG